MNWQYDSTAAELWLNSYMARMEQEESTMPSLRALNLSQCHVAQFTEPPCFRLVQGTEDDLEEVTCRVPGIICSKVLPPFLSPLRSVQPNHVRLLRQHVRLTGLQSQNFNENKQRLEEIFTLFQNALGQSRLEPVADAQYEGDFALDTHTRYLTERRLVPGMRHIAFTADVDPHHVLESARDIHFVRTPDNVVEYRLRREQDCGLAEYEPINPGDFKEGDLVEATVTFLAFPLGREFSRRDTVREDRAYKLVATLRGLTLLNAKFREESRMNVLPITVRESRRPRRPYSQPIPSGTSLKRKTMSSPSHTKQRLSLTTSRRSSLLRLPPEILRNICGTFTSPSLLHFAGLQCDDHALERPPATSTPGQGATLQPSNVSPPAALALSCKALYPIAMEALWTAVFVGTRDGLLGVLDALLASPSLGRHTRAFSMGLVNPHAEDESRVGQLLTCMPNLQFFHNGNLGRSGWPAQPQLPVWLRASGCNIRSVSFGPGHDGLTISNLFELLKAPTLKSLQLATIERDAGVTQKPEGEMSTSLTSLCLGTTRSQDQEGHHSLQRLLILLANTSLHHLSTLHAHHHVNALNAFIRVHGHQLVVLAYEIPCRWDATPLAVDDLSFAQDLAHLCPKLQDLRVTLHETVLNEFIIYGVPSRHPALQKLRLKYDGWSIGWGNAVPAHARVVLNLVQSSSYPQLTQVRVVLVGQRLHEDEEEFRLMKDLYPKLVDVIML